MTFPIGRGPLPLRAGHVHPVAGTCLAVVGAVSDNVAYVSYNCKSRQIIVCKPMLG